MARSGLILPSNNRQPNSRLRRNGVMLDRKGSRRLEATGAPRKHRRPRHPITLASVEPATRKRWLIALILFSLLVHALIVIAIVFVNRHTQKWEPPANPDQAPQVNLVLAPPPTPAPHQPEFIPTEPQANAPHQDEPLISDNDVQLRSKNRTARDENSPLPDVTGHKDRSFDLHTQAPSPLVKSNPSPPSPTQPKEQPQQQKTAQRPPNKATKPEPPDPNAINPTDNPEKGKDATKDKEVAEQYDPNGLPVLPAINAPTIQPQTPQTQLVPQTQRAAPPRSVPSFAVYQSDVSGQAGAPGDNSPAAMATDLGRYKAKVYRAVGARWYEKVAGQLQVLGVGSVHVSYTIYKDGTLTITADPDGANPSLMLLHSISINAMTEAAPFDAFSPAMIKEVGDSFTDDFSFSIYGN
jgi:outer membrane biosynthesis protein TonB